MCADVDPVSAEGTASRIRAAGRRAAAMPLNIRDRAAVAATVEAFGRLDILFESAGIAHRNHFLDLDAETWDGILAVNLTGCSILARPRRGRW